MAIVVQSSSANQGYTPSTGFTDLTINKPTGLAVGDLMIALMGGTGGGAGKTWTASGWTTSSNQDTATSQFSTSILYKVADAGDVAASTFTISSNAAEISQWGCILRVTGANTSTPVTPTITNNSQTSTTNPTFTNTITPKANSLLIMFIIGREYAAGVSGYAIVTSNPTWTEQTDLAGDAGTTNVVFAIATAVRAAATATGNSSATIGSAGATHNIGCLMIAIQPAFTVTATDTQATVDTRVKKIFRFFSDIETATDAFIKTTSRLWSKVTKNISTWVQGNKNI